jgi:hypothetical protein
MDNKTNVPSNLGMQVHKPWCLLSSNWVSLGTSWGDTDFKKIHKRHYIYKLKKHNKQMQFTFPNLILLIKTDYIITKKPMLEKDSCITV